MCSSGLQRLPNGSNGLQRQYRLVIASVASPRRYFTAPRLLQPLPRLSENQRITLRHRKQAQYLQKLAALEENPWQDFDDLSSKHDQYDRRLHSLEDAHTMLQQEHRRLQKALDVSVNRDATLHSKPRLVSRRRVIFQSHSKPKRETLQEEAALAAASRMLPNEVSTDDINMIMTSLQDLASRQEIINHKLEIVSLQLSKQQRSLVSLAVNKVMQMPRSLGRMALDVYRCMVEASDPAMDIARSTKGQMAAAMFGAATYFAFTHPAGHWMRELLDALRMQGIPPNAKELMGLFIHTFSLPLIIATSPGAKKALRHLKRSKVFNNFFNAHPRRFLSGSSAKHGPRKETAYRDLVNNHADLLDKPFPMAAVLNDLRNRQALLGPTSGREYKVAERRLFRVQHESEIGDSEPLTVRQVMELLQPDDSVGWAMIRQRLLNDRVDAMDNLSKEDRARVLFTRVYGIGKTKAERFVQAGFLTLEQLREASLEKAQRIGLEHMDDIECLIPRSESEQWREILLEVFAAVDPRLGAELLGSFRRGDYFSSDLDWVLFHPDVVELRIPRKDNSEKRDPHPRANDLMQSVVDELRKRNLLADELLAHGPISIKGLVRLATPGAKARRIDINFAPFTRRAFYTLAKTGDADLMVHMRAKAKANGWALNEYGIGPHNQNGSAWTQNLLDATEEKQIFDFLKVPYLEPEERSFSLYAKRLKIVRS
ncbi:related to DNA polymerase X - putative [Ustilago trichophora]|uniref:Related to DNA polymerase X - putative n=1 Tax=Ustilago trichophora TaxID=86804 RepID=A0A5C3DX65_9BASI|nr:related to DNA polymerase X - putative [Ustilago trichophora]